MVLLVFAVPSVYDTNKYQKKEPYSFLPIQYRQFDLSLHTLHSTQHQNPEGFYIEIPSSCFPQHFRKVCRCTWRQESI